MSLIRKQYPGWVVMIILSLCVLCFFNTGKKHRFTCRAQLDTGSSFGQCGRRNLLDLFMAMDGDGDGYLMLSGKMGCQESSEVINAILDFDYEREGGNYDLHVRKHNVVISKLLPQFSADDLTVGITRLDDRRYLLSTDQYALLVCKSE
ncbi:hypothetical protein EC836_11358 [Erwinia sp. JUb26]|nr:hypothetical protein EC836_11358 [Erwinia sp. JUb26]